MFRRQETRDKKIKAPGNVFFSLKNIKMHHEYSTFLYITAQFVWMKKT